ncbi:MAG: Mu transposase C-terminal domain-containing protein [Janthinobacterium lividum]
MPHHLVPGVEVDYAGQHWRIHCALGPDAVLLRNAAGEIISAEPARIDLSPQVRLKPPTHALDERRFSDAQWATAAHRHDLLTELARNPSRRLAQVDEVAKELGVKRRRVYVLLGSLQSGEEDVAAFLPRQRNRRARRLDAIAEAVIAQAIDQHYAQASRPNLSSLHRTVADRCVAAGVPAPSTRAVQSRVRDRDQAWLTRRRLGPKAARALRLLTGAHPGASAPWERVQIDSTPCDIRLVREVDRAVIGRPNFTIAVDLYSRVVPGFSVSLEAASTVTVATCLTHACLPKEAWLAARDFSGVHWPVYGKPRILEYDQGPENEACGIQRGLRRHGIASKVRAKGHPEQHGTIERLIGTMMRIVDGLRGTTFSNVDERGEAEPEKRACLTLPELERVLALSIDSYNHTTHDGIGERPMDRYLAWYRRSDLRDGDRIPPRLPADRLLLDFLPHEKRALSRSGIRLFRVDYSSIDLLPLWQRDNQQRVERIVVYDPRSLAQVWILDETTDTYIGVPTRVPRPDMTLAQSEESRRALHASKSQDRTEERLYENVAKIQSIEGAARTATTRRKTERSHQAAKSVRDTGLDMRGRSAAVHDPAVQSITPAPAWTGGVIDPFPDVERL